MKVEFSSNAIYLRSMPYPTPDDTRSAIRGLGGAWSRDVRAYVLPASDRAKQWLVSQGIHVPGMAAAEPFRMDHGDEIPHDTPQPGGVAVDLFPYQRQGVAWLSQNPNALLADEQGLGKTLQAIAACKDEAKVLAIVPSGQLYQWRSEILRALPTLVQPTDILILTTGPNAKKPADFTAAQWVLTSPDLAKKWLAPFQDAGFTALVVDEAQAAKNLESQRTQAILSLSRMPSLDRRILITGTPIMNRPVEIYALQAILGSPMRIGYDEFVNRYCAAHEIRVGISRWTGQPITKLDVSGASNLRELSEKISQFTIRRDKATVQPDLPPKILSRLAVELDAEGRKQYALASTDFLAWREKYRPDAKPLLDSGLIEAQVIGALRQISAVGKADAAHEFLNRVMDGSETRKVLVVSDFLEPLNQLQAKLPSGSFVRMDGSTSPERKEQAKQAFQSNPQVRVMLGQTQVAGVGHNLQSADTVVFMNCPWRPTDIQQAVDRLHRIGQTAESIQVVFLEAVPPRGADRSIDSELYEVVMAKDSVIQAVFGASSTDIAGALSRSDAEHQLVKALGLGKAIAKATKQIQAQQAAQTANLSHEIQIHRVDQNGNEVSRAPTPAPTPKNTSQALDGPDI